MEAGNRCFDQRVPEESNRKIVDHISDLNLTYSDIAREYLLREGLPADRIIKTGSPMFEVLMTYLPKIEKSTILTALNLEKGNYFVVSAHREENINSEKNFTGLLTALNLIAEKYILPIIVSTHPRTRKKLEELYNPTSHQLNASTPQQLNPLIQFHKPLGLSDYLCLQVNSKAVLSDSGTISEESSILNFRALNIREAHERPEAMEEASVMMVGLNPERIMQGLEQLQLQSTEPRYNNETPITSRKSPVTSHQSPVTNYRQVADYSIPNVSDKVVRIIISYTDYIKRTVWSE
jgi:UDP-N-acetylglucosamine 2-epimerase (non-hydrolysing)